ncbi:BNR/Asp-box repeat domain protein [Microscilla marina ATCC 23134]|uniref:BNR/Asp-box repeat domain protein n=2 Tax=Microscilla marina TaxID=1027 RepID=A1ZYE2_MICM2|nr:BNR/Asp-box repeat domain protein [Microscilla marina ATCC 23134]
MQQKNANFYDIKKSFDEYWQDRPYQRARGYKQFKRWEYFWEKRVLPNGSFPQAGIKQAEWSKYVQAHPKLKNGHTQRTTGSGNWSSLGPSSSPGGYDGVGRINCVSFDPQNVNTFYVGTPAGGLWKTTNGGSSWTNLTDNLPIIGVSSIAIHPSNGNIMYIATGDADGGDTPSLGVMKSTDGGATWNTTGLNWQMSQGRQISVLLIHPNNPDILVAATSEGIYKTTNAGASWSLSASGFFRDLELKPGTPSTMYATGRGSNSSHQVFVSTNTGSSWTQTTNFSGKGRVAIAVSAASPGFVAAVASGGDNGFAGFYTSNNSGASFSLTYSSASKNLLGWDINGNDTGGQGWYDLAITVSPTNANLINIGGVNNWQSTDGGSSWTINTMWYSTGKVATVHADKHYLVYHSGQTSTMYECNDGGIYKTTNGGTTWTDLTNGMAHTQFYKIGVSQSNANYVVTGAQDNGTKLKSGATWANIGGGDGMECIIDPTNENIQYYSIYYGRITRRMNGSYSTISDNVPGKPKGAWVTPYALDPSNPQTIVVGYKDVYRSTNRGDSWSNISNGQTGTSNLNAVLVAPSSSNTIYASSYRAIYRTTNTSSWSNITSNLPVSSSAITYIAVAASDPNKVWVTLSGYSSGHKVYQTTNGGSSWVNISGSLPNLPVNCIVEDANANNGSLYIGTDVGIFYRNNALGDWISFSNGLPNVVVRELEIQKATSKLKAGTYGRGLWESNLYNSAASPTAPSITSFSPTSGNIGTSVTIQGINFSGATAVRFNGVGAVTFNVVSTTQITATVPTGASTGKITVTTGNGTSASTVNFSLGTGGGTTATYCESKANSTDDSRIEKVVFNTINNSSGETGNTQNGGCVSYSDFSSVSTNVVQGQTHSLSITLGTCGGEYSKVVKVFIDWNHDGDFDDGGEEVAASAVMSNGVFTQNITVPSGATNGTTRMRVVCREKESGDNAATAVSNTKACGTYSWGETEDYSIVIGTSGSAPVISGFSPTSGVEGNQITINGSNFTGAGSVLFNGVSATFNIISSAQITAIVPANATTGKIKIAATGGVAESPANFTVGNATYCKSGPDPSLESASDDSRIDKVVFGSIHNVTNAQCATYSDYTSIATQITPGQTLPLAITLGTCGSEYSKVVKVFIDWNGDRDFDDANEIVAVSGVIGSGNFTKNITAPTNLTNGNVRMRVVCREKINNDATNQDAVDNTKACGFFQWGETQDYTIQITGGSSGGGNTITYCSSSAGDDADSRIERVVFNTIDNSSASGCTTYSDFTSKSTSVEVGKQYTLSVTLGTCGTDYSKGIKVYVDWNRDGDFDDSGEEVAASAMMNNGDFTANITVPANATGGTTRMRLVLREKTSNDADNSTALAAIKPCGQYSWGETEDYSIIIPGGVNGIGDTLFAKAVSVSPNPANDRAVVKIDNFAQGEVTLHLLTAAGVNVRSWKVVKNHRALNIPLVLSHLAKGVYLLQVKLGNSHTVKRMIKN